LSFVRDGAQARGQERIIIGLFPHIAEQGQRLGKRRPVLHRQTRPPHPHEQRRAEQRGFHIRAERRARRVIQQALFLRIRKADRERRRAFVPDLGRSGQRRYSETIHQGHGGTRKPQDLQCSRKAFHSVRVSSNSFETSPLRRTTSIGTLSNSPRRRRLDRKAVPCHQKRHEHRAHQCKAPTRHHSDGGLARARVFKDAATRRRGGFLLPFLFGRNFETEGK